MASKKATGGRRRRLHQALRISVSLVAVLAATPVLAQEAVAPEGGLEEPETTPYQFDTPTVSSQAPGAGYQVGEVGGAIAPLEVFPAEPGQQPDQGQPPGAALEDPGAAQEGPSPGDPTDNQNLAQLAAQEAQLAAQAARLAASDAQDAVSTVQQSSAPSEDIQVAQQAAQEAQLAASEAQEAAEASQLAAIQEDAPSAQEAAQEAQEAAQEARQTSGAIQQVARQVAQQAVENFGGAGDLKDAYARALQVARSADGEGHNVALADEASPKKEAEVDSEKAPSSSEETNAKAANGKVKGSTGDGTEPEEDAEETGSNTTASPAPDRGGFPLLLGGGVVLAAGAFVVARKLIWS